MRWEGRDEAAAEHEMKNEVVGVRQECTAGRVLTNRRRDRVHTIIRAGKEKGDKKMMPKYGVYEARPNCWERQARAEVPFSERVLSLSLWLREGEG